MYLTIVKENLHFFSVFDEAALTDDLLVQLVEALKKHKDSAKNNTETEITKEKDNEKHEGTVSVYLLGT